ncbi:MAG TPA: serine protein kinase RIO [Methanobacterium sp.]|jgi:RIO kinase 1|uniref:serine protein kinase RIO n=1 Tax=Methanobacterium sp. MZD130B TaxID=3394378 RepID=UPI001763C317|nr:serine protein kinase RIO [Methanobacterium sp.]
MESPVDKSDIHLQKMREVKRLKSVEDRRVGSEVFDRITLQTLYKLANQGHIHLLNGAISTGKEANVFKGADEDGNLVAVKIYRVTTSDFKKMQYYIQGDPRFNIRSNSKRQLINNWVLKEFKNLNRAYNAGVRVPKPLIAKKNILVMEFIGDKNGTPARLMQQTKISNPDNIVEKIIEYVKKLYNDAEIVHGDLSAFNILIHHDEPVIIDLSQSLVVDHPLSNELLNRDINNLIKDFKKIGIKMSKDDVKRKIKDL